MGRKALMAFALLVPSLIVGAEELPYRADWESLQSYEVPDWFRDAKFGIYTHWGPYSASGAPRQSDWYSTSLYWDGSAANDFHRENWGDPKTFGYKDLIPLFKGENFDAEEWADLFVRSGARFAGPVAIHADGFSMWDSALSEWNAADKGPKRDVVGELEQAIRARGLKFLTSFHHQWKWGWYPTGDTNTDTANSVNAGLYGESLPSTAMGVRRVDGSAKFMRPQPMPSDAFSRDWLAKIDEVVQKYEPDLLWFDNRMQILPESYRVRMAANYYNSAEAWDRDVVLSYKRPDMPLGTGTVDLERNRMPDIYPEPWLTDSSIDRTSWGYASEPQYYSTTRLVRDLVDIVSKNGNLLLNVAPRADGTIPQEQKDRLLGIGEWLRINGEAIYGSRPWLWYGEGPTQTPKGHLSDVGFDGFSSEDIRFTYRDGALYVISFGWPTDGKPIRVETLSGTGWNETVEYVELLGSDDDIRFTQKSDALEIYLPDEKPCQHAWVFKVRRRGEK